MMEDLLEMEEIKDALEDEDHQAHQDPLVQKTHYSTATPGHFGYYSPGKYFWNSQPVYVTIG